MPYVHLWQMQLEVLEDDRAFPIVNLVVTLALDESPQCITALQKGSRNLCFHLHNHEFSVHTQMHVKEAGIFILKIP